MGLNSKTVYFHTKAGKNSAFLTASIPVDRTTKIGCPNGHPIFVLCFFSTGIEGRSHFARAKCFALRNFDKGNARWQRTTLITSEWGAPLKALSCRPHQTGTIRTFRVVLFFFLKILINKGFQLIRRNPTALVRSAVG